MEANVLQPAQNGSVSIWRPVPPDGYVSMGDYVQINNYNYDKTLRKPTIYKLKEGGKLTEHDMCAHTHLAENPPPNYPGSGPPNHLTNVDGDRKSKRIGIRRIYI